MTPTYEKFLEKQKEIGHYRRILTLMDWDMYTAVPEKGYADMAETYAHFSAIEFAMRTDPALAKLLEELMKPEEYQQLSPAMQRSITYMHREMQRMSRIPAEFQRKFTEAKSASQFAWTQAKQKNDFSIFAPHLKNMIDMTRQQADYMDPDKEVYELLVDEYEEGMDTASIDRAFDELKEGLLPLIDRLAARPRRESRIQQGTYPIEAQRRLQEYLLRYIGFDFSAGTAAESEHPFTLGFSRDDVRLTNHFHEHDPLSAIFSAIHEGGHGIFAQNVSPELKGTSEDDCRYMGVHESQSRFFENILGRRKSFWMPIYSEVQELLPDLQEISLDEFMEEINDVRPSLIRCDADEVTYCLHIIIRYELERMIFTENIPVEELPRLWNEKYEAYLHITPDRDSDGILQDMHWSDGSFGYFPSYLLGSIYDGMILDALEKELGNVDQLLADGQILRITHWLGEHIHRYGSLHKPKEVLEYVCGGSLTPEPLLRYFKEKYE